MYDMQFLQLSLVHVYVIKYINISQLISSQYPMGQLIEYKT
jgi:hypothetical protein